MFIMRGTQQDPNVIWKYPLIMIGVLYTFILLNPLPTLPLNPEKGRLFIVK